MKTKFKPSFKEKDNEQFYYTHRKWVKCGESLINSLWIKWLSAKNADSIFDNDGFLVFGYSSYEM